MGRYTATASYTVLLTKIGYMRMCNVNQTFHVYTGPAVAEQSYAVGRTYPIVSSPDPTLKERRGSGDFELLLGLANSERTPTWVPLNKA